MSEITDDEWFEAHLVDAYDLAVEVRDSSIATASEKSLVH
jgi:hypothetical protein